jgi:NADP-dependent aldehyde dehydrogenase
MNHGSPLSLHLAPRPTSVGIPTSITRFAKLDCYDAVRPERLPAIPERQDPNPNTWRSINGDVGQRLTIKG